MLFISKIKLGKVSNNCHAIKWRTMDSDDAALLCLANLGSGLWPAEEIMTKMTNLLNVFLFKIKRVIYYKKIFDEGKKIFARKSHFIIIDKEDKTKELITIKFGPPTHQRVKSITCTTHSNMRSCQSLLSPDLLISDDADDAHRLFSLFEVMLLTFII